MYPIRSLVLLVTALVILFASPHAALPVSDDLVLSRTDPLPEQPPPLLEPQSETSEDRTEQGDTRPRIDGAVIRAWRQVAVAAEVQGVIERRYGKEGVSIASGAVVYEISPDLFATMAKRAKERLAWHKAAREESDQELKLKEELLALNGTTMREVVKARSAAEIAAHKETEARLDLELAVRDLNKCKVRAPFTGPLVSFHRDTYESVQRFEQLFMIADTSKVYAVANVPQAFASLAVPGAQASFLGPSGAVFPGTVDKVDAAIDPASQTRKVYVLIANTKGRLEMGMLGQVVLIPAQRNRK